MENVNLHHQQVAFKDQQSHNLFSDFWTIHYKSVTARTFIHQIFRCKMGLTHYWQGPDSVQSYNNYTV